MKELSSCRSQYISLNSMFVQVLTACASLQALEEGRDAHEQVIQSGCNSDVFVFTILVDMYAKWEHGGCWESVQQDAVTKCYLLDNHDIGTCEMLTRAEGIGIILTNASGRCAARP